ncbi:MAG: 1,4-alpha-glucan branching protein GlgB [Myxococcota bacterium]|jgi:1,4-alpha-glucan branching enzyme|nr:1,4-alpha-glucan branching protein GlgB [Myxococcota bacterium]
MASRVSQEDIARVVQLTHHDPFTVLGAHPHEDETGRRTAVRAFVPEATDVWVLPAGQEPALPMQQLHPGGFFEAELVEPVEVTGYLLRARTADGAVREFRDSYAFLPQLGELDLHLFREGTHEQLYRRLGAHHLEVQGVGGVRFAVWAPNARRVSVVGDFNCWDPRRHPMRVLGSSGVWEIFVPGIGPGTRYKYQILDQQGRQSDRADPFAFAAEQRPHTASVVAQLDGYEWGDAEWLARRRTHDPLVEPLSIYELHLGSWMRVPEDDNRWLTYRELAAKLIPYVKGLGFTHVEFLPLSEHPLDASWGYQVTGYFAATSRFGSPQDLMFLIDQLHQAGIGVILDWVPAHFPADEHALARFDGTALYEHEDPRLGEHQDWGTKIFNFGRNEVRNFLAASASFWLDCYHIDGLRVDAVASMIYLDYSRQPGQWIPNRFGGRENLEALEFLKRLNETVYRTFPGTFTIAEESTAFPGVSRPTYLGGLGFGFKWNMGWMHDSLEYMGFDPVYRKYHHNKLTFSLVYAFHENFILPLSHDEVVHLKGSLIRKMPGDEWQKFANLRLLYGTMWGHPGKKMLFMGSEFAQWDEWNHDKSLDWHLTNFDRHKGVQRLVGDLNRLYRSDPALYAHDFDWEGFCWLELNDSAQSTLSWIRFGEQAADHLLFACNYTPVPREGYRIGVPEVGFYRELLNSDALEYGGSGMGNQGGMQSEPVPWQGQPASMTITLPPLGVVVFGPRR